MTISAPDFDNEDLGGDIIPIENVGVWCETIPPGWGASACLYQTITTPLGLTDVAEPLITNGTGNLGDASLNTFTLNWEMGSMEGTMESVSMFDRSERRQ